MSEVGHWMDRSKIDFLPKFFRISNKEYGWIGKESLFSRGFNFKSPSGIGEACNVCGYFFLKDT
ncbi:hypothetical protein [Leptospira stimsonii]|uniref:Uncharacterized protein n=1 Tax=Leptospira stimsonii TaxID=2202203 RepID=A0ABY2MX36_9LEPT|nr:hypothetical protein [Leptospira stimsonii]TGK10116.1 hypothetical protein EHO98_23120 [Leptospira stimsonii]TGM10726.1 hypothetical protein EHQ90_17815 [Leptospira stimsonii]